MPPVLSRPIKWELVTSVLQNVKKGDHLMCKGLLLDYEHHLLCTEVKYSDERQCVVIKVVEYTGDLAGLSVPQSSALDPNNTSVGIKVNQYTYAELEEKEAKKEIWPEELERFDDEEVIRRAESREGELWYDIMKNNCELFVMWCTCGLNVSSRRKNPQKHRRTEALGSALGEKTCRSFKFKHSNHGHGKRRNWTWN